MCEKYTPMGFQAVISGSEVVIAHESCANIITFVSVINKKMY